jgi:asparagine synthase (glutamine-hydrolysing)
MGVEVAGGVGLAHTRLAIVDPSPAGRQPMSTPDGRWTVTYNGEVFNHMDLRAELDPEPYRGGSDTETLLRALAAWGPDAVRRCNGLFAFAALDRERRRLLLVRDRFGVKPLYLARRPEGLWFASEMRALLAAGVEPRPRLDVLQHFVAHGWANGTATPIEGIHRLLPGTMLLVDIDSLALEERGWYRPMQAVDPDWARALARLSSDEACDALEATLHESVRRRLMADVPVGMMCSGGLDSSLLTAFAVEEHNGIHAYNASVPGQPEVDEARWARSLAAHLGIELHTVELTPESWRRMLVDVVRHHEYPLVHPSSVAMSAIAGLARSHGVKVLLSGEGADELFGGYDDLHVHDYLDFRARGKPLESSARTMYRRLQAMGLRPVRHPEPVPGPSTEVNAFDRYAYDGALRAYRHHRGARRRLEARLLAEVGAGHLPHLLNRQDKTTMRNSIETREPFLDPDVVALALNLPLEARVEPTRKAILREVARRWIPITLIERSKLGFSFEVIDYFRAAARPEFVSDGMLRELVGDCTHSMWRPRAVGMRIWTAEVWARLFLGRESVAAVEEALWRNPDMPLERTHAAVWGA